MPVATIDGHPILIPKGQGELVAVCWLRGGDGRCLGKDFFDATPGCRKAFMAQARQVNIRGTVSKQPENGHYLDPPYEKIYELKPGDFRFFGFRDQDVFYITNAAPKNEKKQEADYRLAARLRQQFLDAKAQAKKADR